MTKDPILSAETHAATQRVLQILAGCFWGPSLDACEKMMEDDFFRPFDTLAPLLAFEPVDTLQVVRSSIQRFADAAALYESLEEEYLDLFVTARNGIPAPLYASCYEGEDAQLMGPPAIEMQKRIAAKGLVLAEETREPPDHLSIEIEYLYFLLGRSDGESPQSSIPAAAEFAAQAMIPWVEKFTRKLSEHSQDSENRFYPMAATLLLSVLRWIAGFDRPEGPHSSVGVIS